MKPLAIDLYAGLGGWAEGFLAEGFDVIGFDIEPWPYPGQLVLQDVLTLHGSQFRDAAVIVASPPCQAYSYRAMPWKRAKALPPPSNELFDACFRIQREACEAAGRHIPMVVENVRGAQKWVGRAKWNFGSYYLWGDVPALMPFSFRIQKFNPDGTEHGVGSWFKIADSKQRGRNFHAFENGLGSSPSFNGASHETRGVKTTGHANKREGYSHTRHLTNQRESDAIKNGKDWFESGENCSLQRRASSGSNARKAASAQIAKIPWALAVHIARTFKPAEPPSAGSTPMQGELASGPGPRADRPHQQSRSGGTWSW